MWFQAIVETVERAGWQIVTVELLASEAALVAEGLQEDYIDALIGITRATEDNGMALVTASPADRARAVAVVRLHQKASSQVTQGEH
jgi:hypothetical protein